MEELSQSWKAGGRARNRRDWKTIVLESEDRGETDMDWKTDMEESDVGEKTDI